ncbi:MAG TPA: thioredoxin [Methanotrichaceae archaeon]|nr:thioredoxin [Methanotrichaceae archaeon]
MAKPILMDFYADWCGPCKMQTPIMEELEHDLKDKAEFKKINVDKDGELASKYNIFVVPTLVLEKDGQEINRWMGVTTKDELSKAIDDVSK